MRYQRPPAGPARAVYTGFCAAAWIDHPHAGVSKKPIKSGKHTVHFRTPSKRRALNDLIDKLAMLPASHRDRPQLIRTILDLSDELDAYPQDNLWTWRPAWPLDHRSR